MGDYAKLAVFIVVLLLSVSLMSVAIDYLGDISDVELDMEPQDERTESVTSDAAEAGKGKTKPITVAGAPGGEVFPLFEIHYPPRTKYIRLRVGEAYDSGLWEEHEDHPHTPRKSNIPLRITTVLPVQAVSFTVNPFYNLTSFIPATLHVTNVDFEGTLEHYPSLELFSTTKPSSSPYNILYALYDLSEARLLGAEVEDMDEYLAVPEDLEERLEELASDIVRGLSSPWEKVMAIEAYLEDNYEYGEEYTPAPDGTDPVEWFLFDEKTGTCGQFNSALVLLARAAGIPARVVYGFLVSPEKDYQLVMPKDAHLWAEVPFKELDWITFDATPGRPEDVKMESIPTSTNITYNDDQAIKGGGFTVEGTVTMYNGSAVDGLSVEVLLTERKNETGVRCGTGTVNDGVFKITCDADPSFEVGDYQLVAHAMSKGIFQESWSDPPIRIMAETEVSIQAPPSVYVGDYFTVVGTLVDRSNGQPISNTTIVMTVKNETKYYTSDEAGSVSFTCSYDAEGNETLGILVNDSTYYLGSNSSFGVAVGLRPPPQPGLLEVLTTFPYNVMLAAGAIVTIGAVVLLTRKKRPEGPQAMSRAGPEEPPEEDLPRHFEDYKEGIVTVFNWFYARAQRRHVEIADSMTPREFQRALLSRIPENGASALEYLVTAFEIADYSTSRPTKEMCEKCIQAVELLDRMMQNG
jgi:transglutaminase-like putative cysteine protease